MSCRCIHVLTKAYKAYIHIYIGFPGGSLVKNSPASAGNASSIHESGSSPGEGNGNPLQYPCLGKSYGQRNLSGYSPCGGRVGHHNSATEQQEQ